MDTSHFFLVVPSTDAFVFFSRLTLLGLFFLKPQVTSIESTLDSDELNSRRQLQCEERLPTTSSNDSDDEACLQALQAAEGQSGGGLRFQLTPYTVRHRPSFGVTWQTFRGRLRGQPSSGDASEEVIRALGQAIREKSRR